MGPRSIDRGIWPPRSIVFWATLLQWGRDRSLAELSSPRITPPAWMKLQWGRDRSIAELSRRLASNSVLSGFNGAAIDRSRNFPYFPLRIQRHAGFNGAAIDRSRNWL